MHTRPRWTHQNKELNLLIFLTLLRTSAKHYGLRYAAQIVLLKNVYGIRLIKMQSKGTNLIDKFNCTIDARPQVFQVDQLRFDGMQIVVYLQ